jgi:imidazolonepropionase-like amidohydrolase
VSRSLIRLLLSLLIVVGCSAFLGSCSKPNPDVIAITHVTVIDSTGAPPQTDSTVLVSGERISAVRPANSIAIPHGARVVDGTGKFLISGLADMHIHLTAAGEPGGSREFILPLLVANGITTIRDMGGRVDLLKVLRDEIRSGKRLGPQIFFTGPYLDGNPPSFQPSIVVQNAAEATAAVDRLNKQGVDFIKVQSRLQPQAYFAIARESKKLEIRFVGHVPDSITAAQASEAGQASIEHLTGVLLGTSAQEDDLRRDQLVPPPPKGSFFAAAQRTRVWQRKLLDSRSPEKTEELIREFVRNRTWQVPTFPTLAHLGFLTPETDLGNDARLKYVPAKMREIWEQGRKSQLENRTAADFHLRSEIVSRSLEIVGKMNTADVPIMAGTDAPAPNVLPGFALHEDLLFLVQAGLTPMQALQAATLNPAKFLGRSDEQGSIAPGKRADLVLLDANPQEDIRNTQKIRAVVLNGRVLERSELDTLLARAQRFAANN